MDKWEQYDEESKRLYAEWKKRQRITNVEILPEKVLLAAEDVLRVQYCLENDLMFVLISPDSFVTIDPKSLTSMQDKILTAYTDKKQLQNTIKLLLLACDALYIPGANKEALLLSDNL